AGKRSPGREDQVERVRLERRAGVAQVQVVRNAAVDSVCEQLVRRTPVREETRGISIGKRSHIQLEGLPPVQRVLFAEQLFHERDLRSAQKQLERAAPAAEPVAVLLKDRRQGGVRIAEVRKLVQHHGEAVHAVRGDLL